MVTPYTYAFIRKDISPEQQIVQTAHAALEAGFVFDKPQQTSFLILLEVPNQEELNHAADLLDMRGIQYHKFFEPDNGMGYSAICTAPLLCKAERNFFKRWPLYRA